MPKARELFPLGEPVETGRAVDGIAAELSGFTSGDRPRTRARTDLWLDFGHTHWGLTLGPVSGRLLAEMMTGATPFCDPDALSGRAFSEVRT